jgi:hypothetical protein
VTNDEKKEYLNGYKKAKINVEAIEETIIELREQQTNPKIILSDMPHGNGNATGLEEYAWRYDELVEKLKEAKNVEVGKLWNITETLMTVDDELERAILLLRYVKLMRWDKIADACHYSVRQTHQYHRLALAHLEI